jgi:hypothetical protein
MQIKGRLVKSWFVDWLIRDDYHDEDMAKVSWDLYTLKGIFILCL